MAEADLHLLQVSDMHLQASPESLLHGVNVEQRFLQVLEKIRHEQADLLLLTGDLSHHAPEAYSRLSEYLEQLPFPSIWIPGNHDLSGEMYRFAGRGYGQKVVDKGRWRLLMLDSTADPDGHGGGALSEPELEFLRTELEMTDKDQHVLIVLHHHPVSVNSVWQDRIMLANAPQFWSVVERYPQVKGVVFGHVHQAWQMQRGQVSLFSVPATARQFKVGTVESERESDPRLDRPAYARYCLSSSGQIEQSLIRVSP